MRYLLIGGSSAALELAIFWVLSNPLDLDVRISNVIAVFIATVFNFAMNRQWTFKSSSHWVRSAVLYLTLWSLNLVFTTSVIALCGGPGLQPHARQDRHDGGGDAVELLALSQGRLRLATQRAALLFAGPLSSHSYGGESGIRTLDTV